MKAATAGPAAGRRSGGRKVRGRASRRGRVARQLTFGLLVAGLAVVAAPFVREAIDDLTLPLSDANIIRQQAAAKELDPALVAAVIYAESKFDPRPSPTGARGLMQLEPQTAQYIARRSGGTAFKVSDLDTPRVNIAYGTYYLRELIDHYGGDVALALAAYNAGQANVDRWLADARARGHPLMLGQIPFPETRLYVQRVLQAQQEYRRVYAKQLGY